ncbi:MAG: ABC transporter substrate-binding protein [Chthoniobacteraceae bacterium]
MLSKAHGYRGKMGWRLALCGCLGIGTALAADPARTVVDAAQARVEVPHPSRGVALYCFMLPEYLAVTRSPGDVAAAAELSPGAFREGHDLLRELFPGMAAIRNQISGATFAQPNLETLLALDPGVVIHWREYTGYKAQMERIGLPVVTLGHARREEWLVETSHIFAEVSGMPERAHEMTEYYRQSKAALASELQPATLPSRPRVLRLWMPPEGGYNAVGKGQLFSAFIDQAGGAPAIDAPGSWVELDIERLLLLNPDVILISSRPDQPLPEALFARPEWQPLRAVQTRRIYSEPPAFSNLIAAPLYCRWLAELLHPDRLRPRLRELFQAYYRNDFNYAMSDAETDARLFLKENSRSAGYERFCKP